MLLESYLLDLAQPPIQDKGPENEVKNLVPEISNSILRDKRSHSDPKSVEHVV